MTRTPTGVTIAVAAVAALGCLPAVQSPTDGSSGDATGIVTYTKDVQPILGVKCAPCHTTDGSGGHNIGTNYADALAPVTSVDAMGCWDAVDAAMPIPKKRGECALISIMNGWMPMSMYCFNTPRPAACVSLAEQDVIAAWVAAGMPQ
jgi:hypothetical protein